MIYILCDGEYKLVIQRFKKMTKQQILAIFDRSV